MLPVPLPLSGGDLQSLRQFVNVEEVAWPLVLGWLVAALRDTGPYPVLVLNGEQGSAKSTTARVLRMLIDPNKADLRSEPKEPRDLMIAATNGLVVAFDNISRLPSWLSDALCRLATGGGFSTRTLYENDEETIFEAQRPAILNGINEVVTRGDLLDRAVTVTCPVISDDMRRTEAEFWHEFEIARPGIFGGLLDAASYALSHVDETKLERIPRMADFALWVVAAEPALGLESGTFISSYTENRDAGNELVLEGSPVVGPLIRLLGEKDWEGTATELLLDLDNQAGDKWTGLRAWPRNGRSLSGILRRLAPNLRAVGVEIDFTKSPGPGSKRIVRVRKGAEFCDANDANDANGAKTLEEPPSHKRSVAPHSEAASDASHDHATHGVVGVANITTRSKSPLTSTDLSDDGESF